VGPPIRGPGGLVLFCHHRPAGRIPITSFLSSHYDHLWPRTDWLCFAHSLYSVSSLPASRGSLGSFRTIAVGLEHWNNGVLGRRGPPTGGTGPNRPGLRCSCHGTRRADPRLANPERLSEFIICLRFGVLFCSYITYISRGRQGVLHQGSRAPGKSGPRPTFPGGSPGLGVRHNPVSHQDRRLRCESSGGDSQLLKVSRADEHGFPSAFWKPVPQRSRWGAERRRPHCRQRNHTPAARRLRETRRRLPVAPGAYVWHEKR
jgi:hypothetical protein